MPALDARIYNLLLGLAWLGSLDRSEIRRLWFPDRSEPTVKKTLTTLHHADLIIPCRWSARDEAAGVTRTQQPRWMLTPAGHAQVKPNDQYPAKPLKPRGTKLLPHDARTTATIVRLIEIARPHGLCGFYVAHEVRLDPDKPRPICDALVILQVGGSTPDHLVPWSSDPAIADESRYRYAIEADNSTEPLAVIRGKAHAYAAVHNDDDWRAWWTTQYGPAPIPVWVTPSVARAEVIHQQWQQVWPDGGWFITDDARLVQNSWRMWLHGQDRTNINIHPRPRPQATPIAPASTLPTSNMAATPAAERHVQPLSINVSAPVTFPPATPSGAPVLPPASVPSPARVLPPVVRTPSAHTPTTVAPRPMTINPSAAAPVRAAPQAVAVWRPVATRHVVLRPPPPPSPSVWRILLHTAWQLLCGVGWLLWWMGWLLILPVHIVRWAGESGWQDAVGVVWICYLVAATGGILWLWFAPPVWFVHLLSVLRHVVATLAAP